MRAALLLATLALAGFVACASCSGDEQRSAPDAGLAGGTGGDAALGGSGGGSGGALGGGTGGTLADALPDVNEPGWELAPWNPPGCLILRATDLAKAVPPLVWNDCNNAVAGCVYLDTSLLPGHPDKNGDKVSQTFDVARRGTATLFTIVAKYGKFEGGPIIYELGHGPRAAWKSDRIKTECSAGGVVFGAAGGAAIDFGRVINDEIVSFVLHSKSQSWNLDGSPVLQVDKTLTGNPLAGVFDVKFSPTTMALEMGMNALIWVWDFGSGPPVLIPRPANVEQDYGAIVKGTDVVFMRYSSDDTGRAFAVRHASGAVETLYQKPSVWADALESDGSDFVWQEWHLTTNVVELWTAPWTASPASFAPKKVRTVDGSQKFVSAGYRGEKWWVQRRDESTLRAIRITDGAYLDVPAPSGFGWVTPLGVVDGEIWATIFVSPGSDSTTYSVVRVPIASLGTPVP